MDKIFELAPTVLAWSLAIVGGASVLAAGIAPLTKTDADDKVAKALKTLHSWLGKLAFNPKA